MLQSAAKAEDKGEGLPREGPVGSSSVTREPQSNHKMRLLSKSLQSPYAISTVAGDSGSIVFLMTAKGNWDTSYSREGTKGVWRPCLGEWHSRLVQTAQRGQRWRGGPRRGRPGAEKAGSQAWVPGLRFCCGRDGVLWTPQWLWCPYFPFSFASSFPGGLVMLIWEMSCAPLHKHTQAFLCPGARFQKQNILVGSQGHPREHRGSGPTGQARLSRT